MDSPQREITKANVDIGRAIRQLTYVEKNNNHSEGGREVRQRTFVLLYTRDRRVTWVYVFRRVSEILLCETV